MVRETEPLEQALCGPGCTSQVSSRSERDLTPQAAVGVQAASSALPVTHCLSLLSGLELRTNRSSSLISGSSPWKPTGNEPSGLARQEMSGQ